MTAMDCMLEGLFDYAGLYPPASVDMRTAVRSYLRSRHSTESKVLGRFVVDIARVEEMRAEAGDAMADLPVSLIVGAGGDTDRIGQLRSEGVRIEALEWKAGAAGLHDSERAMTAVERYVELPAARLDSNLVEALKRSGLRVKLRSGGLEAGAFPSVEEMARALVLLAEHKIQFKVTAGLHHPLRGEYRLTYASDSLVAPMHGFVNVVCAAALAYGGGGVEEVASVLAERDAGAWRVGPNEIVCGSIAWSADEIREVRQEFLTSIGSCSFVEPLQGLEALGWR